MMTPGWGENVCIEVYRQILHNISNSFSWMRPGRKDQLIITIALQTEPSYKDTWRRFLSRKVKQLSFKPLAWFRLHPLVLVTLCDFNAAMTPEEELFEVRYNNWMYHLWTDFVTPPDSWCPLDLNMARTPGIRSAHITNMLTKLHHITWCPFFPKIKSSTITYLLIKIRVVIRKKGVMWEKFPSGGPPPAPPSLGIFTFFYLCFLPFYKPWIEKK